MIVEDNDNAFLYINIILIEKILIKLAAKLNKIV